MPTLANFPLQKTPAVARLLAEGTLPEYHVIDQLNDDGDPNGPDDCWAVSICMATNYLTGGNDDGAEVNTAVYGAGHVGGGDAWDPAALAWIASRGCHLDDCQNADDSNIGDVLAYMRRHYDAGHPVITTWPSLWGIQTRDNASGYHAVDMIGYEPDGNGGAVSYDFANPWTGVLQTYDADWVASRVVNAGAMWRVSAVTYQGLGAGFDAYATAHGLTAPLVTPGEVRTNDPRFPGESFAVFAPEPSRPAGTFLYYTDAGGVVDNRGPWLVWELFSDWQAAKATIAKLQSQPAPTPAPAPVDQVAEAAKSALKTLAAALAASAAA